MTERPNPLYHEVEGTGAYNALIEYDGMNRFETDDHQFHMFDRRIANAKGATLRFSRDRDVCDLKVYHPTEEDDDGDTCSIAVYEFYNLHLDSTAWGNFYFKGLLTSIRRHVEEPVVTERDGYPYIPPILDLKVLPLAVTVVLYPRKDEEDA